MAIGFWSKVGNFFKGIGKGIGKVLGFVGKKILPVAQVVAPAIAGAVGGPGAAAVASKVVGGVGNVLSGLTFHKRNGQAAFNVLLLLSTMRYRPAVVA
jgi:hypothetical protein